MEIPDIVNAELENRLWERWNSLTKPPGSLGRLESLVVEYALMQGTEMPRIDRKVLVLFCADHGVTAEGISAFPREVTAQMVKNFLTGGAAISVLCRRFGLARFREILSERGIGLWLEDATHALTRTFGDARGVRPALGAKNARRAVV